MFFLLDRFPFWRCLQWIWENQQFVSLSCVPQPWRAWRALVSTGYMWNLNCVFPFDSINCETKSNICACYPSAAPRAGSYLRKQCVRVYSEQQMREIVQCLHSTAVVCCSTGLRNRATRFLLQWIFFNLHVIIIYLKSFCDFFISNQIKHQMFLLTLMWLIGLIVLKCCYCHILH